MIPMTTSPYSEVKVKKKVEISSPVRFRASSPPLGAFTDPDVVLTKYIYSPLCLDLEEKNQ